MNGICSNISQIAASIVEFFITLTLSNSTPNTTGAERDGVHGSGHQRREVPRNLLPAQPQAESRQVHRIRPPPQLHPRAPQVVRVSAQVSGFIIKWIFASLIYLLIFWLLQLL